jgi:folate-dependent phosphoribosylglycinamide formyltransferase PurN
MSAPLDRPIRVVLISGAYLDPPALRFALELEDHPAVHLAGILCQASGTGWWFRLRERWQRRGLPAVGVELREALSAAVRLARSPAHALARRAAASRLAPRIVTVPDVHAPQVVARVREWQPDLVAVYGAPILRAQLFELAPLGTFGIHHGRVPDYRGRKTTFWEMYNGEDTAGVTIQRLNAGIDTGDVVRSGAVTIGSKSYSQVERETQELGFRLFLDAILEAREGRTRATPQQPVAGRRYGQPTAAHLARLWLRQLRRRLGFRTS